jgi:DNA-binding MarR family transcriptional regulator
MASEITTAEYRALAELRHLLRRFLREGDLAAQAAGLEPQQYLMLLAIRGLPDGVQPTITAVAERLAVKHHSAVELLDRLEARGFIRRMRDRDDRRLVQVSLTPRGERVLASVVAKRISELRANGAALVDATSALLERKHEARAGLRPAKASRRAMVKKRE